MNCQSEIWKPIQEFDKYQVSNQGNVRSRKNGYWKILSLRNCTSGHLFVTLWQNKIPKQKEIHRLVLETFVGPSNGLEASHLDGNPQNNYLFNLRWETRHENMFRRKEHGVNCEGEKHPNSKLTEDDVRQIRLLYGCSQTMEEIAQKFNIDRRSVSNVVNRKLWRHVK